MRRLLLATLTCSLMSVSAVAATDEDPTGAGSFSPAGELTHGRNMHTATLLDDGRVLVIGGGGADARGSAVAWDLASASFTRAGTLAKARKNHTATLLSDGRVVVIGGGLARRAATSAEVWTPVGD